MVVLEFAEPPDAVNAEGDDRENDDEGNAAPGFEKTSFHGVPFLEMCGELETTSELCMIANHCMQYARDCTFVK